MLSLLLGNYLLKKKKDKFTTSTTSETTSSTENKDEKKKNVEVIVLLNLIGLAIAIYSIVLFFQCYKLKNKFNFLEFLGALCYPLIYIIYRVIFSPELNCISDETKLKRAAAQAVAAANIAKRANY
jgi:hypothetical protein